MKRVAFFLLLAASRLACAQNALPLETMLGMSKAPSRQGCPQCTEALPPAVIKPPPGAFQFATDERQALEGDTEARLAAIAKANSTLSLVVIKNDRLVFEQYGHGISKDTPLLSLSMAKSLISIMIGRAVCDGKIASIDDRAEHYAKTLSGTAYGSAAIKSLLTMSSGADPGAASSGEADRGDSGRWAFGAASQDDTLRKFSGYRSSLFGSSKEGDWSYKNLDVYALSLVLQAAYGKSIPQITQEKLWDEIGAESQASWVIDKQHQPIVSSFFLATSRDWMRVARYLIHAMAPDTSSPCMAQYLNDATRASQKTDGLLGFDGYGFLFWTNYRADLSRKIFWLRGFAGQLIGVDTRTRTAMVLQSLDDGRFTDAANTYSAWVDAHR